MTYLLLEQLVDKLNTEDNTSDIQFDCAEIRCQNERESKVLEDLFSAKKMFTPFLVVFVISGMIWAYVQSYELQWSRNL